METGKRKEVCLVVAAGVVLKMLALVTNKLVFLVLVLLFFPLVIGAFSCSFSASCCYIHFIEFTLSLLYVWFVFSDV